MSTALYRRYRPDTFADVIGQEHVTTPLMTALSKDRVNHAYLFSGPRGCGKTTSARILARCLNCAEGPTPTPCGKCDSCVELASGGPGSLDVIEIDAASHGGVEDARDLRERATFAPARDRYKIFIIDEAHMVTSAGFNALLKIVEEPPPHIKFIFATTEPDKVIGTIRSRTHHYPFRLVPPEALLEYLKTLCERENVQAADGVLPLVIRAGGGSVRDTLSVLDQLMAGATSGGIDYETAVSLLGYTHATLLDEVALALHENDGASLFNAIDRIVQTGLDPRRFVEDLLERFRDLIIAKAVPEGVEKILRGMPADQLQSLKDQSELFGSAELSRWADVTNQALTEMTGATSPRLHLELLAARLLLPAADDGASSLAARLDRLERHAMTGAGLPDLQENLDDTGAPDGYRPSPEANRQGAAAVREALAAARARKQGSAPESGPESASQFDPAAEPAAEPAQSVPPRESPTPPPTTEPASETTQPQPQPRSQAADQPQEQPTAEVDPLEPNASLNTGPDADWGATWGPIENGPSNPVTTQITPAPSVPAERPEGVSPFSLVPDPNSGEDLSFGTGVPIDDVKQNAAMAEFAKRAASQRPPQQTAPQQNQQPGTGESEQTGSMPSPAAPEPAQSETAQPAEQQRQAEETARREQAQQQEAARQQAQQREAAQRAEQQRQAEETARREQAQQQEAARQQAQQREAAQRAEQQRQAEEIARREQAQQQQPQQVPAPQQAGGAGGAVQAFQQAWPTVLEQLQGNSRVLHSMVANYAQVAGFDGRTLTLAFSASGPLVNLRNRPDMMSLLSNTISQVMRQQVEVVLTEGGSAPSGGGSPKGERRPQPASAPVNDRRQNDKADAPAPVADTPRPVDPPAPAPNRPPAAQLRQSAPLDEPPFYDEPPFDPYEDSYPPEDYGSSENRFTSSVPTSQTPPPLASEPDTEKSDSPTAAAQVPRSPRSFDGPPIAPPPRMTAGMTARQAEEDSPPLQVAHSPAFNRPVSDVPLRPGSTTDSFDDLGVPPPTQDRAPTETSPSPSREPSVAEPAMPPIPPPSTATPQDSSRTTPETPSGWGEPQASSTPPPAQPAAAPAAGQKLSRYQRLMNQAQGTVTAPVETSGGSWGQPQSSVPQRNTPQPTPEPEEFVPSEDDIAVEDSALIGVPAIERLLGGMVIEQRDASGNIIEIRRSI